MVAFVLRQGKNKFETFFDLTKVNAPIPALWVKFHPTHTMHQVEKILYTLCIVYGRTVESYEAPFTMFHIIQEIHQNEID